MHGQKASKIARFDAPSEKVETKLKQGHMENLNLK